MAETSSGAASPTTENDRNVETTVRVLKQHVGTPDGPNACRCACGLIMYGADAYGAMDNWQYHRAAEVVAAVYSPIRERFEALADDMENGPHATALDRLDASLIRELLNPPEESTRG